MIYLERPAPPAHLLESGVAQKWHLEIIHWAKRSVENQQLTLPKIKFPFQEHVFGLELEKSLRITFAQKCVYCESVQEDTNSNFQLLYYRPFPNEANVKNWQKTLHYFWLAWQWPNMYLACPTCYEHYMNNGRPFPVENLRAHPTMCQSYEELFQIAWLNEIEKPLILDPCYDNPEEHIQYILTDDSVELKGASKRGEVTISVLELNREALRRARKNEADHFEQHLKNIWHRASGEKLRQEDISGLLDACAQNAPFAGLKRYILRQQLLKHQFQIQEDAWQVVWDQLRQWREETAVAPQPYPLINISEPLPPPSPMNSPELDLTQIVHYLDHINHENYFHALQSILRLMFSDVDVVIVKGAFDTGFSGAQLFHVRTKVGKRATIPCVVKIDEDHKIDKEYTKGKELHGFIPNAMLPIDKVIRSGVGLSGIQYPLGGDGKTDVMSFKQYIKLSNWENIQRFMQEDLFPTMDELWSKGKDPEFSWRRYDFLLPANLEIEYETDIVDFDVELSVENWQQKLPQVNIDSNIKLSGFNILEIEKNDITLNLPDETLRIKVIIPEGTQFNRDVTKSQNVFLGKVIKTRQSTIVEKIDKAFEQNGFGKFNSDNPKVVLPGNIQLRNPLTKLNTLLNNRSDVYTSHVHGDLNLENILVEHSPLPSRYPKGIALIDFATVREDDHILHDFLRLETSIWLYIVSEELEQNNLTHQIAHFFNAIHQSTGTDNQFASLKSYHILRTIRQKVRNDGYLMREGGWDEYFRGLVLYMLGALKYDNLDNLQTTPSPKLLAFWVACLAYNEIEEG